VFSLDNLDKSTAECMCKKFEQQGWCFVQLSEQTVDLVSKFVDAFDTFLQQDESEKLKFHVPPIMGYEKIGHKQVFRHMTGTELERIKLPFKGSYADLAKHLDELASAFVTKYCETLFRCSPEELNTRTNVPILRKDKERFGVLDAVRYFKDKIDTKVNENKTFCTSHYDPGLFAISLHSDAGGLQFFDPVNDIWVDQPKTRAVAVMWCGAEIVPASNKSFRPAIHRVLSQAAVRTSIWYEMCTKGQVSLNKPGQTKTVGNKRGLEQVWEFLNVHEPGTKRTRCITLKKESEHEKFWQACKRLEAIQGIPAMKSIGGGFPDLDSLVQLQAPDYAKHKPKKKKMGNRKKIIKQQQQQAPLSKTNMQNLPPNDSSSNVNTATEPESSETWAGLEEGNGNGNDAEPPQRSCLQQVKSMLFKR